MESSSYIFDWNHPPESMPVPNIAVWDETLRDGLQSPSIVDPPLADKLAVLRLLVKVGVQGADLGLPGASQRQRNHVAALARMIEEEHLPIFPYAAARTLRDDIAPIAEISQEAGIAMGAAIFVGTSFVRQYVESWTIDWILRRVEESISFAVQEGLQPLFVTEDTTRSNPETLRTIYRTAVDNGATHVYVCDTVGHATPDGTRRVIQHIRSVVGPEIGITWNGHNDRGLALANALTAIEAGANVADGTALGIGERLGNTPLGLLLLNLKLLGWLDHDLTALDELCHFVGEITHITIPPNYPAIGRDAFRTSTGIHAAAIIKAMEREEGWLANRVYSGMPAEWLGRKQEIRIGPMSGRSNVLYWLRSRGIEPQDGQIGELLSWAKALNRVLEENEIEAFLHAQKLHQIPAVEGGAS